MIHTKASYLILICLTLIIISCEKDIDPFVEPNPIQIGAMEVGQQSSYILLQGEKYNSSTNNKFSYTKDTLILTIIDEDNGKYFIEERITEQSALLQESEDYYWAKDSVFTNVWYVQNDSLFIEKNEAREFLYSHIVMGFHNSPFGLPLNKVSDQKVEIKGWKTDHPYVESDVDLYTEHVNLLGHQYDLLNVFIRNSPMSLDGNGTTYMLDEEFGFIRVSNYSWWTSDGVGWDRL